eukprot:CAMPEP_0184744676 /NCGR_PEP_ID=MMETSP0315-20130426/7376_1 /TAXON_ID=101924 /ORGANISM="Rhodosorus marinus, Strain UTEX LB 2760" /LENGTH=75 /DNA_ID=CAMNT_0027216451 /DNA_START=634 /DNA_END=861 /DNA_ORIENTATION=-
MALANSFVSSMVNEVERNVWPVSAELEPLVSTDTPNLALEPAPTGFFQRTRDIVDGESWVTEPSRSQSSYGAPDA